ncbi:MAG: SurA N-terminal domain-containing protein [Bacteroidales bacterium]|jgi:peptidyl-prolyl cis-trans isomerase D|nr:SurA N-terminal domain-containing protein [Bacteroidales bacterium]MCI2121950.1 SurA N-terminal domain-containing protein [Bacteroidales bacterium]MCI2144987.1 SurA N-terminal domain-containing protein [Bacteroidales bacterium]
MAVLQNIRVKFGVLITILIALALLSFIIDPDTLRQAMSSMSSKNDVGKMNGEKISYREFQEKADYFSKIQQNIFGKTSNSEDDQDQIYNTAWNSFLDKYVYSKAISAAGVRVCEDEIVDLTQGDDISPVIARDPVFRDNTGKFSHERLVQFIKAASDDPSSIYANYWDYVEGSIKSEQMFEKYTSLMIKSNVLNNVELKRAISESNVTSDVDFVMVPYTYKQDSTITVTENEIRKYYEDRKSNLKQSASRDIAYAVYDVSPSVSDIEKVREETDSIYDEFRTTGNLKAFLAKNSDTPLNNYYFKDGELAASYPELDSLAFDDPGEKVTPLFKKGDSFMAGRIASVRMMPDSVFVRHILLQGSDADFRADSLVEVLRHGGKFSDLAAKYSADQNTQVAERGDLGWFTQRYMIQGFDTVFVMRVGEPAIVKSNYGTHVVMVKKRTKPVRKVKLAVLTKSIPVGKDTYQNIFSDVNGLASAANGKYDSLVVAAKARGVELVPAKRIKEGSHDVGSYKNVREVARWAFNAKVGNVSSVISANDKFFVVALTGIHKAGFTPLEDLEQGIRMELVSEKSAERKNGEIAGKVKGMASLSDMAQALGTSVSHKDGISFGAYGYTQEQLDPKFIGAVSAAEKGVVTGPVQCGIGSYIFEVTDRNTGSFFTESDAKNRNDQICQRQLNAITQIFQDDASVTDNRARFF